MSDLPPQVTEAGLLFQRTGIQNDPAAFKRISDWGHAQIDSSYPEDPLRAPLNPIRRKLAHMEWDRVVRTSGRELRGTIANALVRELEFDIQRRQADILARDAEGRRQDSSLFDTRTRIQEFDLTEQIKLRHDKERMRFAHDLQQEADAAASGHRITERINETEQEIIRLLSQALIESAGTSAAQEMLDLVGKVSAEVTRIRQDDTLSDDDKHLHIKTLLDSLPLLLRRAHES